MKIKIRTKVVGFDIVPEHRSTSVLNWIYFLETGSVFNGNKFELHLYFIKSDITKKYQGDIYYIDRDVVDRFKDGYASFVSRHLQHSVGYDINNFIENIYYYRNIDPKNFDIYLDVLNSDGYTKVYDYNEIEKVRDLLEKLYNKKIDNSIRCMHLDPHGDEISIFEQLRNQKITNKNLQYIMNYYS